MEIIIVQITMSIMMTMSRQIQYLETMMNTHTYTEF